MGGEAMKAHRGGVDRTGMPQNHCAEVIDGQLFRCIRLHSKLDGLVVQVRMWAVDVLHVHELELRRRSERELR